MQMHRIKQWYFFQFHLILPKRPRSHLPNLRLWADAALISFMVNKKNTKCCFFHPINNVKVIKKKKKNKDRQKLAGLQKSCVSVINKLM